MDNKIKINIHSMVDVITNSSTELFCTVKGKTEEQIQDILNEIVKEFGCTAVDLYVHEHEYWDDEEDDYIVKDGVFDISYSYETSREPCKMMRDRLTEIFGEYHD